MPTDRGVTRLAIAYDGSEPAQTAVTAAARLFPSAVAAVVTVHERPPDVQHALRAGGIATETLHHGIAELHREVEAAARATAEEGVALAIDAGLQAEPHTVATGGGIWPELAEAADRLDADVVVCGTRGRGGLSRAVLGSVSSSLLHHADRPVLVVPPEAAPASGPVLVGFDGSDGAREAVEVLAAVSPGADVVVAHVWSSPARDHLTGRMLLGAPVEDLRAIGDVLDQAARERAEEVAGEGAALATELGLRAQARPVDASGAAWRGLVEAADAASAAMVVAGSRGRGAVASALLGSVSHSLVNNAQRPTLIARRPSRPA